MVGEAQNCETKSHGGGKHKKVKENLMVGETQKVKEYLMVEEAQKIERKFHSRESTKK
jgi:hypothetical protein